MGVGLRVWGLEILLFAGWDLKFGDFGLKLSWGSEEGRKELMVLAMLRLDVQGICPYRNSGGLHDEFI